MKKQPRTRRKFTQEFKNEIVRLVRDGGRSRAEVCREFELADSLVRSWIMQAKIDEVPADNGPLTSAEREELRRLRKENRVLQMEREILKRAATFFAKESK